jgi:hypothetical protein
VITHSRPQQNLARPLILSIDTRATEDLVATKGGKKCRYFPEFFAVLLT